MFSPPILRLAAASAARITRPRLSPVRAVLLAAAVLTPGVAAAQEQPTLLQRLREMLGLVRPISVGGSRAALPGPANAPDGMSVFGALMPSAGPPQAMAGPGVPGGGGGLCLLSPWIGGGGDSRQGPLVAITPSGSPPIVSSAPLTEVQILKGETLLWRGRASSAQPLANPLAWPLPPLQPGDSVLLKLRMQASDGATFSKVELRRPPAAVPLPPSAGSDPVGTLAMLVQQDRQADVVELLFQGDLNGNPQLQELARTAMNSGCRGVSAAVPIAW
jgi:hypothetical protein